MYGVTVAVARECGYAGPMKDMPLSEAKRIYRLRYWDALGLESVGYLSAGVALEMFECGVNCGIETAGTFLQRALNALNRQQKDYPDVEVDGNPGPKTLGCLSAYLAKRGKDGETVLVRGLNCLQGARYFRLAEAREKDEKFLFGWLFQRVRI